ncbi:MAG TPA: S41 family peptidase [Candidatus Saccharimonadales bacterium]|nr:S41 family peptidase [Candidatus Saccharimonadales bacterium]
MNSNPQGNLSLLSWRLPRRRFLWALLLAMTFASGAVLDRWLLMNGIPVDSADEFRLMAQAWNLIDRFYVDRAAVRHTAMAYGAISGMTDSLGDTGHSTFLSRTQAKKAGSAVQGRLTGIGVTISSREHQTVIVAPMDGSPAQLAGARAGDIILEVNGHSTAGLTQSQVSARIAGDAGQSVELTVVNPRDNRTRDLKIERAAIKLNNISWQRLPGTDLVHLRIAMFSEGAGHDLRQALLEIKRQGLRGIILDVRNNPGGVLDEATATASQFLKSGNVFWERNAQGKLKAIPVQPGAVASEIPLVVLINAGSASDSEIVAGALHDAHRGELVGETTFGTGTVLSEFQLADGSALLLAVEEWLTPDKRSFWHKGIDPDVRVSQPPEASPLLPGAEREMTAEEIHSSGDAQLLRAISVLSAKETKP